MKKMFFVMAALAAVFIGFVSCNQPNSSNTGNGGGGNKPTPQSSYTVTFKTVDAMGTLDAKVNGKLFTSGKKVATGSTVEFTVQPKENYVVDKWTITGGVFEKDTGKNESNTAKVKVASDVMVQVSFKAKTPGKPPVAPENPPVTPPDTPKIYDVTSTLNCVAGAMKIDFGKGGQKNYPESIMEGTSVTVDKDGKMMLTIRFKKTYLTFAGQHANVFVDPTNSKPGYYDMGGIKQDAAFTVSKGDTADNSDGQKIQYVTSMTFPVSKEKSEYYVWIYINSSVMGAQFSDGKGTAGPNEPNKHSKYAGKLTINWSTMTER